MLARVPSPEDVGLRDCKKKKKKVGKKVGKKLGVEKNLGAVLRRGSRGGQSLWWTGGPCWGRGIARGLGGFSRFLRFFGEEVEEAIILVDWRPCWGRGIARGLGGFRRFLGDFGEKVEQTHFSGELGFVGRRTARGLLGFFGEEVEEANLFGGLAGLVGGRGIARGFGGLSRFLRFFGEEVEETNLLVDWRALLGGGDCARAQQVPQVLRRGSRGDQSLWWTGGLSGRLDIAKGGSASFSRRGFVDEATRRQSFTVCVLSLSSCFLASRFDPKQLTGSTSQTLRFFVFVCCRQPSPLSLSLSLFADAGSRSLLLLFVLLPLLIRACVALHF